MVISPAIIGRAFGSIAVCLASWAHVKSTLKVLYSDILVLREDKLII